jgi:hypothetical protein
MTTDDWVVLAMLWWHGRGRAAIDRWLSDPAGASRTKAQHGYRLRASWPMSTPACRRQTEWGAREPPPGTRCGRPERPEWTS